MTSRWDKLGQQLDCIRDPLAYRIKASIRPWMVHPDVAKENDTPKQANKRDTSK